MVAPESEIISQGEVESQILHSDYQQSRNNAFPSSSLGRQSSIYSLTLDEFQHTLCGSGKNFGSMNMDEFLNSIWTAEENQAHAQATSSTCTTSTAMPNNNHNQLVQFSMGLPTSAETERCSLVRQPSLHRQASLTLPAPLSRKTVDEVWSEIQKTTQHGQRRRQSSTSNNIQNTSPTQRQATFGEMTLEDFLVKAGVVREQGHPVVPLIQQQPFGLYQNSNPIGGPSHVATPIMGLGGAGVPPYPAPQSIVGEPSAYAGVGKRSGRYHPAPAGCYGGRVGNGSINNVTSGYGQAPGLGIGSPVSPLSSDGICGNPGDSGNQYGLDMGGVRGGRKRIIDGPVEKVVERRQRRMIKNRESAARSRARKQAYTVELEAELNQVKEENAHLRQALAELERKRNQQIWCNLTELSHEEYFEEPKMKAMTKAQKAEKKMEVMRRNLSCPY